MNNIACPNSRQDSRRALLLTYETIHSGTYPPSKTHHCPAIFTVLVELMSLVVCVIKEEVLLLVVTSDFISRRLRSKDELDAKSFMFTRKNDFVSII